ncbi:aluminum-activated malate transporter 9-like [Abrus precatorius]|uniref:Aluminum-activated malate transporter 9-like n=1 Tax=Abrus precatorius TaxID=3816 RepID=A0A8B8M4C3_ABRPR|nr:aluminum-activated malate transporter 9-like [Abrus precatorius]
MESIEVIIPTSTKPELPETDTKSATTTTSCKAWLQIQNVWEFCKEDTGRVIFALKVGLAVLLVSLLILFGAPYQLFGPNIVWAILTAILVFEYTVGATFNRGFNRALGSLMAGILAIAVAQTAMFSGHVAEPIIIGLSIFIIAVITSFMKMWPSLVEYEYGFRVILLSYCLIIISGYRMGNPIRTMIDRLCSIAIGGTMSVLVNVLIFPIWAGELLHTQLVNNFYSVADSLEECVKKYLEDGSEKSKFTTASIDAFQDEPAYKRCESTLNSGPKLETLANSAKWEPPHGRFLHFSFPWSQYVQVGAVLRHCAYEVMTLHSIVHAEIQAWNASVFRAGFRRSEKTNKNELTAPYKLRVAFGSEILEASNQAAELVRIMGRDISSMKWSMKNSHIKRLHSSTERLQRSMHLHSYLFTTTVESPDYPSRSLAKLLHTLSTTLYPFPDQRVMAEQTECYHESMRKQLRRLYSWPSIKVDVFEEDHSGTGTELLPRNRMRALESTAALSLVNFTSSLVEFVARVDHLVEAVDKLSKMAKFKPNGL